MTTSPKERSYSGPLAPLTAEQETLRDRLRADVQVLAGDIGERNLVRPAKLFKAARWIEAEWKAAGYKSRRQTYAVEGRDCHNLEVEIAGAEFPAEIVLVGAHYDSVAGAPGANDNGSGVAAMLALSRLFADRTPRRTLRFVAFVNEEPPYFQRASMGSRVYARRCRQRQENIVAMLSLETVGYYTDRPGSQRYPPPLGALYPSVGNFIGFVGDVRSRQLVDRVTTTFRRHAQFPSEKAAFPPQLPGVGWSDQWSFWQEGFLGVMVTDTAPFRYPHYHTSEDTPDKLDYGRMARVVSGLEAVVIDLAKVDLIKTEPADEK